MEGLELYNKVRKVPNEAKKAIAGGRLKGMTDINPMWRLKVLTEQFGPCGLGWYYEIIKQEIIDGANGEKVAFVNINLFVKYDGEWSKPIQGSGGSSFIAKERNGLYTSDECFKMALTDSIGSACKLLGVAADVYFEKDRSKYDLTTDDNEPISTPVASTTSITASQLITLAKAKGVSESSLIKKYNVSEIKFIKKESKKEAYDVLISMPDKK